MKDARSNRLLPVVVGASVFAILCLLLQVPGPLRNYYHSAAMLYYHKQWEYHMRKALYDTSEACYEYTQHPDQYLQQGTINRKQYNFIKQHGYMSDCDKIMALK